MRTSTSSAGLHSAALAAPAVVMAHAAAFSAHGRGGARAPPLPLLARIIAAHPPLLPLAARREYLAAVAFGLAHAAREVVWRPAEARRARGPYTVLPTPAPRGEGGGEGGGGEAAAAFEAAAGDTDTLNAAGLLPGSLLLLNLWRTPGRAGPGPAASGRPGSGRGAGDALLGCAAVDLALLPALGEIVGWYPVVSSAQQQQGQLRVHVRPDPALSAQLAALPGAAPTLGPSIATATAAAAPARSPREEEALVPLSPRILASPKSVTFTRRRSSNRMFAGLRS
jgi:hypothetical protein